MARRALDEFHPDFCVIWGDDQFENYREDWRSGIFRPGLRCSGVSAVVAQSTRRQFVNEPKDKSFTIRGSSQRRQAPRFIAAERGL